MSAIDSDCDPVMIYTCVSCTTKKVKSPKPATCYCPRCSSSANKAMYLCQGCFKEVHSAFPNDQHAHIPPLAPKDANFTLTLYCKCNPNTVADLLCCHPSHAKPVPCCMRCATFETEARGGHKSHSDYLVTIAARLDQLNTDRDRNLESFKQPLLVIKRLLADAQKAKDDGAARAVELHLKIDAICDIWAVAINTKRANLHAEVNQLAKQHSEQIQTKVKDALDIEVKLNATVQEMSRLQVFEHVVERVEAQQRIETEGNATLKAASEKLDNFTIPVSELQLVAHIADKDVPAVIDQVGTVRLGAGLPVAVKVNAAVAVEAAVASEAASTPAAATPRQICVIKSPAAVESKSAAEVKSFDAHLIERVLTLAELPAANTEQAIQALRDCNGDVALAATSLGWPGPKVK